MSSAKANTLPGVYLHVKIITMFLLDIQRNTFNTSRFTKFLILRDPFKNIDVNLEYFLTSHGRYRFTVRPGHTVKRYVQPTIFQPARTPEVVCVHLLKAEERLLSLLTLQFASQVSLSFVTLSSQHTW